MVRKVGVGEGRSHRTLWQPTWLVEGSFAEKERGKAFGCIYVYSGCVSRNPADLADLHVILADATSV